MTEDYYAGVYRAGRHEPERSYAKRAEALFRMLSSLDPTLNRWFEQANSREAALKSQFTPDAETLLQFLLKRRYQIEPG